MPDEKKLLFKFMNKNLTLNLVDINSWNIQMTMTRKRDEDDEH
jgi:hypothetical protein